MIKANVTALVAVLIEEVVLHTTKATELKMTAEANERHERLSQIRTMFDGPASASSNRETKKTRHIGEEERRCIPALAQRQGKSKSKSMAAAKHKTSDHDFAIAVVNEEIDETKKRLVDGSRKVKSAFDWAYVNASKVGADRNKTIA